MNKLKTLMGKAILNVNGTGLLSDDFLRSVSFGSVDGFKRERKYGEIILDSGDAERTIWQYGGKSLNDRDYIWQAAAVEHFISSSNNADDQIIEISGLDENKQLKTVKITLVGQTKTTIGEWYRVWRAENIGTTVIAGTVFIYEDVTVTTGTPTDLGKVRSYIDASHQQTLQCFYTIPIDYIGIILNYRVLTVTRVASYVSGRLFTRRDGGVFVHKEPYGVHSYSNLNVDKKVPDLIMPLTDIKYTAEVSANDTEVSLTFEMLLVEKSLLGL